MMKLTDPVPEEWISVRDELPPVEERVLAVAERDIDGKIYRTVIIAMYEDGTIYNDASEYWWRRDNYIMTYDDEADDYRINESWWEVSSCGDCEESLNMVENADVICWRPLPNAPIISSRGEMK